MKNDNQQPETVAETQSEATLAAPYGSASWGVSRRYGRLVTDGDKLAVQIETDLRDEKRLQVFLSKSMSATAVAEQDVELMTDEAVTEYLAIQSRCYMTVTPNAEVRRGGQEDKR